MERLNVVKRHAGKNPGHGPHGRDIFTFDIPDNEGLDTVALEIVASNRGGARISERPALLSSGNGLRVVIIWWIDGGAPEAGNGFIEYRIRAGTIDMPPATRRVVQPMRNGTDGTCGVFLKQVGGPVLMAYNDATKFEPASAIKVLQHYHAITEVQNGAATLDEMVTIPGGDFCRSNEDNDPYTRETMRETLRRMMQNSDNSCTEAIRRRFGRAAFRTSAAGLGMADTELKHKPGCGWATEMGGHNLTTLADLGRLYENAATIADPQSRASFSALISSGIFPEWTEIVDEEARALEAQQPGRISPAELQDFKSRMDAFYKGGYYRGQDQDPAGRPFDAVYNSLAGVVVLPFRAGGDVSPHSYVFGVFVAGGSIIANSDTARYIGTKEIVRDEIRKALASFQ